MAAVPRCSVLAFPFRIGDIEFPFSYCGGNPARKRMAFAEENEWEPAHIRQNSVLRGPRSAARRGSPLTQLWVGLGSASPTLRNPLLHCGRGNATKLSILVRVSVVRPPRSMANMYYSDGVPGHSIKDFVGITAKKRDANARPLNHGSSAQRRPGYSYDELFDAA